MSHQQYEQAKYAGMLNTAASIGQSVQQAPIREGGFQMRLLETRKLIEEAHGIMERIEALSIPPMPDNAKLQGINAGPMNLDRLIDELRSRCSDLLGRLAAHENRF